MQLAPKKVPVFECRYTRVDANAECYKLNIGEQELESLLFEIINKQFQIIHNIDGLGDTVGFSVKIEQQTVNEKQLDIHNEEKRVLYERFVLGEIDAIAYKTSKAAIDAEIKHLTTALETLKTEAAIISAAKASDDELRNLANTTLSMDKLSRPLVDLLIDKVYIHPGNHIEILWKYADFGSVQKRKGDA